MSTSKNGVIGLASDPSGFSGDCDRFPRVARAVSGSIPEGGPQRQGALHARTGQRSVAAWIQRSILLPPRGFVRCWRETLTRVEKRLVRIVALPLMAFGILDLAELHSSNVLLMDPSRVLWKLPTRKQIERRRQIELGAIPDHELGRVADPALIGCRRREVPGEDVGRDGILMIAVGRLLESLRDAALDLLVPHQAPHALFADGFAVLPQVLPQAWPSVAIATGGMERTELRAQHQISLRPRRQSAAGRLITATQGTAVTSLVYDDAKGLSGNNCFDQCAAVGRMV